MIRQAYAGLHSFPRALLEGGSSAPIRPRSPRPCSPLAGVQRQRRA
jgi:hypothetical protein